MKSLYPAFGICGYSGAGKTTLIEKLIGTLVVERGLRVGIVKHDMHGLSIDQEGKDSDRFFKAGADVILRGPEQRVFRSHRRGDMPLQDLLNMAGPYYDLILVEGHKSTPMDQKVWLCGEEGDGPPDSVGTVLRTVGRDDDRLGIVLDLIDEWLPQAWISTPVFAGVLLNGVSDEDDWARLEHVVEKVRAHVDQVVLLGQGPIPERLRPLPVLCPVPDVDGPQAGMLAATRWSPLTSWLFLSSDPSIPSDEAIRWLLDQRKPGVWAVQPLLSQVNRSELPMSYYDFRSAHLLEGVLGSASVLEAPQVLRPVVPDLMAL